MPHILRTLTESPQNLVPGTPLKFERKDDRIPVLLIQRSVENAAMSKDTHSPRLSTTTSLHGWTLIVPQGWGMPFLSSLIFTGTRVGGQRERQTQAFEAGCAYHPRDLPTTQAYEDYAEERADDERETWERKPPAKRPNYDKLGTRSPWCPDWGVVLGVEEPPKPQELEDFVDTQRDVDAMAVDATAPGTTTGDGGNEDRKVEQWLLRGSDVPAIVAAVLSALSPAAELLSQINRARAKRKLDPLKAGSRAEELLKGALVNVSIVLPGRGCPDDMAVIYRVGDDEAREWMTAQDKRKNGLSTIQDGLDETEVC